MASSWETYLQPGERILWEGAPLPGIRNRPRLVVLSLFGLPFLIVGLVGSATGLRHTFWLGQPGLGLFLFAFSLIFVLVGLALVIGQWFEAAAAHRKIRYALSTRAAYVARQGRTRSLQCYPILPQTALDLDHCDGHDNLWFHVRRERDSDGDPSTTRIGFEGIAGGTEVYRLIRGIQTGQT